MQGVHHTCIIRCNLPRCRLEPSRRWFQRTACEYCLITDISLGMKLAPSGVLIINVVFSRLDVLYSLRLDVLYSLFYLVLYAFLYLHPMIHIFT